MKKIIFILCFTAYSISAYAQNVGIGTTSPQRVLHIDAKKDNDGTTSKYYDDIVVNNQGRMGIGTIDPKTRLDVRSAEKNNAIGIGTTPAAANAAGEGALRYNDNAFPTPADRNKLSYSDGSNWIVPKTRTPKDYVYAQNNNQIQTFNSGGAAVIENWTESEDVNESFNPSTGTFIAKNTGVYVVALTYTLATGNVGNNSGIEALLQTNVSTNTNQYYRCVNAFPGANNNARVSGQCSGIFNLTAGNLISVGIINNLGYDKKLDTNASYTTLSIFEL